MSAFFEELLAGGAPSIRKLLGRTEAPDVDFKTQAPNGQGGVKEDKRALGKALSAFANSMGGTIVWGVDCRPGQDGVDCVQGFQPIADLGRFTSIMQMLVVEALVPRHSGIRVEPVFENDGTGFLIIDVPLSDQRPHMSMFNDRTYFERAGSSSRPMEHGQIRDTFQRRTTPQLELHYNLRSGPISEHRSSMRNRRVYIDIFIRNISRISAQQPYVAFTMPEGIPFDELDLTGLTATVDGGVCFFEQVGGRGVIHPGTSRRLAIIRKDFTLQTDYGQPALVVSNLGYHCNVAVGCLDCELVNAPITVSSEEMISAIDPHGDLIRL